MDDIFYPQGDSAHERYGFGRLRIGEIIAIEISVERAKKVQMHIHAHGQHYGKKFKTRTRAGKLYVKRIS